MKNTKQFVFEYVQKVIYTNAKYKKGLETKQVADALHMQRSNVSTLLNELVNDGKLEKTNTRPVLYKMRKDNEIETAELSFSNLIGCKGSLRNPIQLAKAAILYPNQSLNMMIYSKSGCGTTSFVYEIFKFAIEKNVLLEDAPFVALNCQNFSKNVSILNDELFGRDNNIETSCFYRARGGVLFIDSIEYLDVRQQSFIFDFIENGKLHTKDHGEYNLTEKILLVLSCNPQKIPYNSRSIVPVIIELPTLSDRSMKEKLDLINHFFMTEANNSKRTIEVTSEAIRALLLTNFDYDVKGLQFEIKTASANAYVRVVNELDQNIFIGINDMQKQTRTSLLRLKENNDEIKTLIKNSETFLYNPEKGIQMKVNEEDTSDVYSVIKKQYDDLADRGINDSNITDVINQHIQNLFTEYSYHKLRDENNNLEQLSKLVDQRVIDLVNEWLEYCQVQLKRDFKSNVFYGLCLHINSLLNMKRELKKVNNNQIINIIENYPKEYAISSQFVITLKDKLNLDLNVDEVVLITMFLLETNEEKEEAHPVLLYIMHGNGTAKSLMEVTNNLTRSYNAYSYDLTLDKETSIARNEIEKLILSIDQGAGIIVLYDMGSIKTMVESISEELNIKVRLMNVPITLIGIALARRCANETDIDYVYHLATLELDAIHNKETKQNDLIITLCHTGEGGAIQLKNYIDQYSKLKMKTIALCVSDKEELASQVQEYKKNYHIQAFVGTYDPKLFGIPFISITKIFENSKSDLDKVLRFEPVQASTFNYDQVYLYLEEQLQYTSITKLKSVLPDVIDEMSIFFDLDENGHVGLFMHLACLIEKLLKGEKILKNKEKNKILNAFEDDYKIVCKCIKPLEKAFKVIINDDEITTIIMIIRKL